VAKLPKKTRELLASGVAVGASTTRKKTPKKTRKGLRRKRPAPKKSTSKKSKG
jgi:hypothetical protein